MKIDDRGRKIVVFMETELDYNFVEFGTENEPFAQLVDSEYSNGEDDESVEA